MLARIALATCVAAGAAAAGLAAADRALEMAGAALTWAAEMHRLRAEFLAALDAPAQDVERELAAALDVARNQNAKLFELRAAASLLRFRQERGDPAAANAARELVSKRLAGLAEGHDSPDAREARALLERTGDRRPTPAPRTERSAERLWNGGQVGSCPCPVSRGAGWGWGAGEFRGAGAGGGRNLERKSRPWLRPSRASNRYGPGRGSTGCARASAARCCGRTRRAMTRRDAYGTARSTAGPR